MVLGEVLWDLFEQSRHLGGAALNFAVHARRLGHPVTLLSAVGADELGQQAREKIAGMDLETAFVQTTARFPTGTARVRIEPEGGAAFTIERPAAYDALLLSESDMEDLGRSAPAWIYYGTLFASRPAGRAVLDDLLRALGSAGRFYDLNLRPGFDSPELVGELLARADAVKLNEREVHRVHEFTGLSPEPEAFCREGTSRYGWKAVAVTLGARGCAILAGGEYAEAAGLPVVVADTVGAGDAFAAAFLHGLSSRWPAAEIAAFANRVGALVASRHGAIPDWTLREAVEL